MACLKKNKNFDIEELYTRRDKDFLLITNDNRHLYEDIVIELFDFMIDNYDNHTVKEFKKKFTKLFSRLSRNSKIKVSKPFIVYIYQRMIKEEKIENDIRFWPLIQKCPARNMSGVNSFAILLSPHPNGQDFSCKHNCYYCPDETVKNGAEKDMPRSYLAKEPAVARGSRNNWDAYDQMNDRMNSLMLQGMEVDKLELILEGGTYTEFPPVYLREFHRDIFYSANVFYDDVPKRDKLSLQEEMKINVNASVRIIGICIETRPDAILNSEYGNDFWIKFFRETGTTRIQLGIQHSNNIILKKCNRGHTYEQSVEACNMLRQNCFKIDGHLMPDLPYSTPELDCTMFNTVFNDNILDQVKIYPFAVVPFTVFKKKIDEGKITLYSAHDNRAVLEVTKYAFSIIPWWMRVPRAQRDIPSSYISAGNDVPNLRQIAEQELVNEGIISKEIRSREIGRNLEYKFEDSTYFYDVYYSNGLKNYFISCASRDRKAIFGFIRLSIPDKNHNPVFKTLENKGLVRELHVYNTLVPVGMSKKFASQHRGIGKNLLKRAEYIAWIHFKNGIAVISGEGVRGYYHKNGYYDHESFVVKDFVSFSLVIFSVFIVFYIMFLMLLKTYFSYLV